MMGGGQTDNHIIVDPDACDRCGTCVAVCPASLVRMYKPESGDGDAKPLPRGLEGKGEHCIYCGHCVAACPNGALSLVGVSDEEFVSYDSQAVEEIGVPDPEQIGLFLRSRRSVRSYAREELAVDELAEVFDLTRWAPSGHNRQDVEWCVSTSRARTEVMLEPVVAWMERALTEYRELARTLGLAGIVRAWKKGRDFICRGAPHLALAHVPDQGVTPDTDAVIAATWLELSAHAHGLGACWAGYVMFPLGMDPSVGAAMGIPEGRKACAALFLGVPRHDFHSIPPRKPLRVSWLS